MLSIAETSMISENDLLLLLRYHNVKNGKEVSEVTEGKSSWNIKVNRVKEIRRRENDGLLHQLHFVMKSREEGESREEVWGGGEGVCVR